MASAPKHTLYNLYIFNRDGVRSFRSPLPLSLSALLRVVPAITAASVRGRRRQADVWSAVLPQGVCLEDRSDRVLRCRGPRSPGAALCPSNVAEARPSLCALFRDTNEAGCFFRKFRTCQYALHFLESPSGIRVPNSCSRLIGFVFSASWGGLVC
eukprot:scaffold4383_cov390-Prasinococcus_capsulatus_cf.AAC.6